MPIAEIFQTLGQDDFGQLIRSISIGKLKSYQLYDGLKARARITKLNVEGLRKATGRLWDRISANEEDLAKDLAQAILLSNLNLIVAVLDFLGVPHKDGFFADDIDPKPYFTEGWPERVLEHFKGVYPEPILRLYVGHLAWGAECLEREGAGEGGLMPEIYVSTDCESDGPIPGPHSMLSFASAAYLADKTLLSTFSANLETLPGASGHPDTMQWWNQPEQQAAWAACRSNLEPPEDAMRRYLAWVRQLPGRPVFVAYPAGFDFLFVYWYLIRFTGQSPFSFSALDVKTFAMALLGCDYRDAVKRRMPQRWFDPLPHSHIALDDAIEQGALFCNMLKERPAPR